MPARRRKGDDDEATPKPKRKRTTKRKTKAGGGGGRRARPSGTGPPPADSSEPTGLASLDLTDGADRALVRRAVSEKWELHGEDLQRAVQLLREAEGIERARRDPRGMRSCVDLWIRIAGQVQSDEQLDRRLAAGQGLEGEVTIRVVRE